MTIPKRGLRRRLVFLLGSLLLAALLGGCSQVRLIRGTPEGGVVSIPTNSNQWPTYYRNRAEYLMKEKCPEGYVIEHEEAFVDNPAAHDGRKPTEDFDYNGGYERITHYRRQEYRITFHRADPPAPGAGVPAPVLPPGPAAGRSSPADKDDSELPPPRPLPAAKGKGSPPAPSESSAKLLQADEAAGR